MMRNPTGQRSGASEDREPDCNEEGAPHRSLMIGVAGISYRGESLCAPSVLRVMLAIFIAAALLPFWEHRPQITGLDQGSLSEQRGTDLL